MFGVFREMGVAKRDDVGVAAQLQDVDGRMMNDGSAAGAKLHVAVDQDAAEDALLGRFGDVFGRSLEVDAADVEVDSAEKLVDGFQRARLRQRQPLSHVFRSVRQKSGGVEVAHLHGAVDGACLPFVSIFARIILNISLKH